MWVRILIVSGLAHYAAACDVSITKPLEPYFSSRTLQLVSLTIFILVSFISSPANTSAAAIKTSAAIAQSDSPAMAPTPLSAK